MKTLAFIWTLAIISGVAAFGYINTSINALLVKPSQPAHTLQVKPIDHNGRLVVSYQEQGGNRQTIQVTAISVPQSATASVQGNQEDGDNLQPAMGYGALGWIMQ